MKKFLGFAASLLMAVTLYAADAPNVKVPDITIPELKAAIQAGKVTLLDANGTKSWQKGHIPGAIDFKASEDKLASLLPADKSTLVVAYCGGPKCMAYKAAAAAAEKLGYTNVKHLRAGISGWEKSGQQMEKGS